MTGSNLKTTETKTIAIPCPDCGGSGADYCGSFFSGPCLRCQGTGKITRDDPIVLRPQPEPGDRGRQAVRQLVKVRPSSPKQKKKRR